VASAAIQPSHDGGAGCRVLRGPVELPLKSPAVLALHGELIDAIVDDDGKPRTVTLPAGPVAAAPAVAVAAEPLEAGAGTGYAVPCAVAADKIFCADHTGAVHRTARDGSGDRVVGSSKSGGRVAAATLAGTHAAMAYLASRQTTEGWVSEAWLVVDDEAPVRLSDEGSGATSITLVPRGSSVLALSVDSRAALTGMHVRHISLEAGKAHLGEDSVVFVGGPGDRRTGAALAVPASGPAYGLLPISKDMGSFGLAIVRIDDPPKVDEPVVWSMYPNGLDPAPVAAVAADKITWAARVLPQDAAPSSARVLQVGDIDASGSFVLRDVVPTGAKPSDLAVAIDPYGAMWLAWVDSAGSFVERLTCTPAASH
jgi:hypothetical protein